MTRLKDLALRFLRDEDGQDLIEYALLATFVALVAIAGNRVIRGGINLASGPVTEETRAGLVDQFKT